MGADAVAVIEARNPGKVVANAAGDEHCAGPGFAPVGHRHRKPILLCRHTGDTDVPEFDPVWRQLLAARPEKLERRDTVACQVTVQFMGALVTRRPRIAEQDTTAAAAQYQRSAEPSGAAADDDNVVHICCPVQELGHWILSTSISTFPTS